MNIKGLKRENDRNETFSILHNNVGSLRQNLENLETHLLNELDFDFDVIGITETKITDNSLPLVTNFNIEGYTFEYVPTPLASVGVGIYVSNLLYYSVIKRTANKDFQGLWIEIRFDDRKNIICGCVYRQHSLPENFMQYIKNTIQNLDSKNKTIFLLGDFNIDLLKAGVNNYSHNFLLALQSSFMIPTIDKPTRVYNNSATLIDNIFTNSPDKIVNCSNIISDISNHYSQFCVTSITKNKPKLAKRKSCKCNISC